MLESLPFQQFHRDKRRAVLIINLVDYADIGMIQRRSRTGLALEPLQRLPVFGQFIGKKLSATSRPSLVSSAL